MKKNLLVLFGVFLLLSCSNDEVDSVNLTSDLPESNNIDSSEGEIGILTNTPQLNYVSPFDIFNLKKEVPIIFKNLSNNLMFNFKIHFGPAYFDGQINAEINYNNLQVSSPIINNSDPLNPSNIIYNGNEININFNPLLNNGGVFLMPQDILNTNTVGYDFAGFSSTENNFLKKYGKIYYTVINLYKVGSTSNAYNVFSLKSDGPVGHTYNQSIPTPYLLLPNIQISSPVVNGQNLQNIAYHPQSREIVLPSYPNFQSSYIFSGPNGETLRLYHKSYIDRVEIVLEEI